MHRIGGLPAVDPAALVYLAGIACSLHWQDQLRIAKNGDICVMGYQNDLTPLFDLTKSSHDAREDESIVKIVLRWSMINGVFDSASNAIVSRIVCFWPSES